MDRKITYHIYNKLKAKIRKGTKSDLPAILSLIKELAEYEKALDKVLITLKELENDGFGPHPLYWVLVVEIENQIVGIAFYYIRYSTWNGKSLYLEDFVIKDKFRRKGIGSMLFEETIKIAKEINVNCMDWQVLNWNTPAINFYKRYKADLKNDWINGKLSKAQIEKLCN